MKNCFAKDTANKKEKPETLEKVFIKHISDKKTCTKNTQTTFKTQQ